MQSMTGYGAGSAPLAGAAAREVFAEISSVNRKGLELSVSLPREWNALEGPLGELAKARLHRGAVRLSVTLRATTGKTPASTGLQWDDAALQREFDQARVLADRFDVPFTPDLNLLLRLAQSTGGEVPPPSADEAKAAVEQAVAAALAQLTAARGREGEALRRDLATRTGLLKKISAELAPLAPASVARYREGLHARLAQIGLAVDLNDERVLREIALFADRCDISEELTRLASHLDQFEKILADDGPAGRKLDFLCQEIHREFNTVGSKAQHLDITRRVLDAKNELERIREQVQNVE
jgi:uncharacterized protein (TIGR00255 family)